jgi:hypothetical protein
MPMADKSNFTPDEWKLILESVTMAGIAVSAADPSGLWGLLKESFAEGTALMTAKTDPTTKPLIKAVVADFETSQGRGVARDGLKEKLAGLKPAEITAKCIETLGQAGMLVDAKRPMMQRPSRAGCARSANTLPKRLERVVFLARVARR